MAGDGFGTSLWVQMHPQPGRWGLVWSARHNLCWVLQLVQSLDAHPEGVLGLAVL